MRKTLIAMVFAGVLLAVSGPARADIRDLKVLSVMAPIALTEPLTRLARDFSQREDMTVNVQFGHTAALATQVRDGAPADVFISSDTEWMNLLKLEGLIDVYSLANLVATDLVGVMAVPQAEALGISGMIPDLRAFMEAHRASVILILPDPDRTMAGVAAIRLLEQAKLWPQYASQVRYRDNARLVAEGVRRAGEEGRPALGITYPAILGAFDTVMPVYTFPGPPSKLTFQATVIAGEHMEEARQFLAFLKQHTSTELFRKTGWLPQ